MPNPEIMIVGDDDNIKSILQELHPDAEIIDADDATEENAPPDILEQIRELSQKLEAEDDRSDEQREADMDEARVAVADVLRTSGKPLVKKQHVMDAQRLARKGGEISLQTNVRGGNKLEAPRFELHYTRRFDQMIERQVKGGEMVKGMVQDRESGVLLKWRPERPFRKGTDDAKRASVRFGVAAEVISQIISHEQTQTNDA